jgi:hypothetical protein
MSKNICPFGPLPLIKKRNYMKSCFPYSIRQEIVISHFQLKQFYYEKDMHRPIV